MAKCFAYWKSSEKESTDTVIENNSAKRRVMTLNLFSRLRDKQKEEGKVIVISELTVKTSPVL